MLSCCCVSVHFLLLLSNSHNFVYTPLISLTPSHAKCKHERTHERKMQTRTHEHTPPIARREQEVQTQREQRVRDMARRTHPKSNADFAVLYNELDSWRKAEMLKIKVRTVLAHSRCLCACVVRCVALVCHFCMYARGCINFYRY
jgi:hypothetical protein